MSKTLFKSNSGLWVYKSNFIVEAKDRPSRTVFTWKVEDGVVMLGDEEEPYGWVPDDEDIQEAYQAYIAGLVLSDG